MTEPVMEATLYRNARTEEHGQVQYSPAQRPISPNASTLEAVPFKAENSAYIFSVPDNSSGAGFYANQPLPEVAPPESRKRNWTAWPFLILYALLIAILSGLIGGFIGKAIESNNKSSDSPPPALNTANSEQLRNACSSALATPTVTVSTSTASATASPSASSTIAISPSLPIPTTGCNPSSPSDFGSSFTSRSKNLGASFTTFCGRGWVGEDVFSMSALSPSDCIEACVAYNRNRATNNATCIGGGFIPSLVNTSDTMRVLASPFNCYLKKGNSNTGKNDRNFEVVSLCLEGMCNF